MRVEPTKQRRFGCSLVAIAKRTNLCALVAIVRARQGFGGHIHSNGSPSS
ncbi:hypothetical protein [Luteibacter rhizovicinus]|nr:hypothetical protein [Luteibacter rhizovicinus]